MLRVCELFGETIRNVCLGVVVILLLNGMDLFSVCVVICVFVCRKLSPHLGELDHRCLLSLCYFLV